MKFTDVLTSTDNNPLYYKFVPIFIKLGKNYFQRLKFILY